MSPPSREQILGKFALPQRSQCAHLGPATGATAPCRTCGGKDAVTPLHACRKHGICTVERPAEVVREEVAKHIACCKTCPDNTAPAVLSVASAPPARRPSLPSPDEPAVRVMLEALSGPPRDDWPADWQRNPVTLEAHRRLFDAEVNNLSSLTTSPLSPGSGRGIVTCAGGAIYFTAAYVLLYLLRKLGCTLPVEVWHLGPEEIDPGMRTILEGFGGVSVRDATAIGEARVLRGWESKVHAILHSAFEEVLFLDADQVPVKDPSYLFDDPYYRKTGAILWPDLRNVLGLDIEAEAFRVAGLPVPGKRSMPSHTRPADYRPVESGQILVDRRVRWKELLLAKHVCDHSEFWWRWETQRKGQNLVYGDKSAFYFAWERLGGQNKNYVMPKDPSWTGSDRGGAFLQRDTSGEVIFQHRCQPAGKKWSLHGHNVDSNLKNWDLCMEALANLRSCWTGNVYDPAGASPEDREAMVRFAGDWAATVGDTIVRRLTLHPDGTLKGSSDATRWTVVHHAGEPTVVLSGQRARVYHPESDNQASLIGCDDVLLRAMPIGWRHAATFDLVVANSIRHRNEYRLPDKLSGVVIDVGAHHGSFAHTCLERGAAHVHCVEPNAANLELLRHNLAGWGDRVTIWPCAAWRSDCGPTPLRLAFPVGGKHSAGGMVMGTSGEGVLGIPFATIIATVEDVEILKVDCEGSEFPLFATLDSDLLARVGYIVGEWHEGAGRYVAGEFDCTGKWLRGYLERAGFAVEMIPNPQAEGLGNFFAHRP